MFRDRPGGERLFRALLSGSYWITARDAVKRLFLGRRAKKTPLKMDKRGIL